MRALRVGRFLVWLVVKCVILSSTSLLGSFLGFPAWERVFAMFGVWDGRSQKEV